MVRDAGSLEEAWVTVVSLIHSKGFEFFDATPRALPAAYQALAQESVRLLKLRGRARAGVADEADTVLRLA
eukprot:5856766-Pyramimonas_sp.AAC.1